jgi:hypothetical protein
MKIVMIIISITISTISFVFGQIEKGYQLLIEAENCSSEKIDFTRYSNWYGIYLTDSGEFLRKINIEYQLYSTPIGNNENSSSIGDYIFWTDQPERAYVIIGSNKELLEHRVSFHGSKFYSHVKDIYPGQRIDLFTTNKLPQRKGFELSALGCVDSYDFAPEISNYKLQISNAEEKWKPQNISKHVDFKGETDLIDLKWFGDIDFDGIPDIILSRASNSASWLYLFLSSEATDNEYVKFVSKFGIGSCN